jgi:hypothetical protein
MAKLIKTCTEFINEKFFSDKRRDDLAEQGIALPDGSFPIESKQDLLNAIKSYGRSKNKDRAKSHIIKRAKGLDLVNELPEKWHVQNGHA